MRTVQIALVTVVVLIMSTAVMAQEKQKKKKGRRGQLTPVAQTMMRMMQLREALDGMDLTDEQQDKLTEIREELGPKMKEAYGKIQDILTDEQQDAAKQAMQEARDAGKKSRALFIAVESAIKYDDKQKKEMAKVGKPMLKLQRQLMKKVRGILTPEQQETLKKKMAPQRKKGAKKGAKRAGKKKRD